MSQIGNRNRDYIPDIYEMLPNREYRCEFDCNKVFKNRIPYEKHLQRLHGIERQEKNYKFFRCPLDKCDYVGNRLDLVRRHFQNNHMEKNFNCEKCDRKFILDPQFIKHRCEAQQYSCPRCPKTFRYLNMRNRHVRQCVKIRRTSQLKTKELGELDLVIDNHAQILKLDLETETTESVNLNPNDEDIIIDDFTEFSQNIENQITVVTDFTENLDPNADMTFEHNSDLNDNIIIEELEQLLRNIENKTIEDPDLIQELAALTPVLQSLQSEV